MAVPAEDAGGAGGGVVVAPPPPSAPADTMTISGGRCGGVDVGASDRGAAGAAAWLTTPSTLSVGSEVSAATVCSSSTADGSMSRMDGEARGGVVVDGGGHLGAATGIHSAMLLGDLVSSSNEGARAEAAAAASAEGRGEPPPPASGRRWGGVWACGLLQRGRRSSRAPCAPCCLGLAAAARNGTTAAAATDAANSPV
eukprot:TRINITY_DN5644_c0_g1_i1.p2 TRINITY_DN5644_c0_g1~~TRINITY_DN5644_c0_g1_i1.p2  ORF type:complete len:198 (-),score=34.74 TRINITY_DN5644_c0_g1_i1:27-620(-)